MAATISKKLSQIFPASVKVEEHFDVLIEGISLDSRQVKQNYLFIATPGSHQDGRQFIDEAVRNGAAAILCEKSGFQTPTSAPAGVVKHDSGCPIFVHENIQQLTGKIAKQFFFYTNEKMKIIGVTGTNGKSSICHFIAQALELSGYKVAVLGTLGNGFLDSLEKSSLTTLDAINIHSKLSEFYHHDAQFVCMEVSSHSLQQGRVDDVDFEIAVFSNLSRDHLDYHGDMAAYASVKEKLFHFSSLKGVVLNLDETGKSFSKRINPAINKITVGDATEADIVVLSVQSGVNGVSVDFDFDGQHYSFSNEYLLAEFNIDNLLLSAAALIELGFEVSSACSLLSQVKPVAGRMQKVSDSKMQPLVIVDYAHTPDALTKALKSLRSFDARRLSLVFGCGGDRDRGKRPMMASVAEMYADNIIVTSDNPRSESQQQINDDILSGFSQSALAKVFVETDRKSAIQKAIQQSEKNDIVLVAGKGHEKVQILNGENQVFDDVKVCQEVLGRQVPGLQVASQLNGSVL